MTAATRPRTLTEKQALAVLRSAARGFTTEQATALDRLEQILLGRKRQLHEYREENAYMKSECVRLQRMVGDLRQKIAGGKP